MTIEFEWDTFLEDDNKWDALFVRINGGRWLMAMPNFGTENITTIRDEISKLSKE
jgi:hypothetical protein